MTLINDHCQDEAGVLGHQHDLIAAKLADGKVAIGENHGKARARAVVGDLIVAGRVAEFFLEFPDSSTVADVVDMFPDAPPPPMRKMAPQVKRVHGAQTVGEYLRHVVASHELTDTLTYYFVFVEYLFAYFAALGHGRRRHQLRQAHRPRGQQRRARPSVR